MIITPFDTDRAVFGGFDLASTTDLTAFAMVQQQDGGGWISNWMVWLPEDNIDSAAKRDNVPYRQWETDGYLLTTPGSRIKHDFVMREMLEACLDHDIAHVGYDPWQAEWIISHLEQEGISPVTVRQGYASLSEPCQHMEASVADGSFKHGANPVARWCAENIEIQTDVNGNIRPVKPKSGSNKRIDLLVATITAIAVAIVLDDEGTGSSYDEPGQLGL